MHELSAAEHLVQVVTDELGDNWPGQVVSVRLRVGPLAGVVPQALRFAYDAATAGTLLERSSLIIDEVPAAVYCPRCQRERDLPDVTQVRCPVCATPTPEIVRGRELEVVSVTVADAPARAPDEAEQPL